MRQWKLRLTVIVSPLFVLFAAVSACYPASTTLTQPPVTPKPAVFEVGPITLAPPTVMVGDLVTVIATVRNTGDVAGTYNAVLLMEGQKADSKDIQVAPGTSQGFSFQLSKNTVGNYNLSIGNSAAVLTVYNWVHYTLQYDHSDGAVEGAYVDFDQGHLVQFSPPSQIFRVQKIRILAAARIANTYELNNMVTFRIWNKDAGKLLWSQDVPWGNFLSGSWQEVAVPDVRVDGEFGVEVVTHSYAPGDPIDFASMIGIIPVIPHGPIFFRITGPLMGEVHSAVLVGFDYPPSYIDAPLNRPPTPSGYSYLGKPIDPGQKRLEGINWLIRVDGEGTSGN
jgi:hypothetical protein